MPKKKNDTEVKSPNNIRVTFQDTEFEKQLYEDIIEESKIVGQGRWMKVAAHEKLQRDKTNQNTAVKANKPPVQTLGELFK